jgi:iron-sulfur cluster repair protein YtfE (RIC family)
MPADHECLAYINHLMAEHRRLNGMLRQMQRVIVESVQPDEAPSLAETGRILARLRQELRQHFAEEDAGGCMEEAMSCCPSLSGDAKRVEAEHPEILAELDALIEKTKAWPASVQNQVILQREFSALCRKLHAHEAAEKRILAQGFGRPVNGDGAEEPSFTRDF